MRIVGNCEYQEGFLPKYNSVERVIQAETDIIWNANQSEWDEQRNQAIQSLIDVSPRLQIRLQTAQLVDLDGFSAKNVANALYDARLMITRGIKDDDPEILNPEVVAMVKKLNAQSSLPYWNFSTRKIVTRRLKERYQTNPNRLDALTEGISTLPLNKQLIIEKLIDTEKYGFVGYKNMLAQLSQEGPFRLLGYSCLARIPGEEMVSSMLGESKFFKLWPQVDKLFEGFDRAGVLSDVDLTVLLVDREPWEVWGWSEENRSENEDIIDELVERGDTKLKKQIGQNARVVRYSAFFPNQSAIKKSLQPELEIPLSFLEEELELYEKLKLSSDIQTTAQKSILTYAAEGLELSVKPPVTVLGIETPIRQRASLYSLARWNNPQPVIQPLRFNEKYG